jgi:rare lipoprotein A
MGDPVVSFIRYESRADHYSNDRSPFVNGRIIDLSAGTAMKLGFYKQGTARVLAETVELEG